MKIRLGFVSNSSSSSFIILSKKELTMELLLEFLIVPEIHPLYDMSKNICKCILSRAKKSIITSPDEYIKNNDIKDNNFIQKINQGFNVYEGWFFDDGDDVMETFLCANGINFKSDDFEIKST